MTEKINTYGMTFQVEENVIGRIIISFFNNDSNVENGEDRDVWIGDVRIKKCTVTYI